MTTQTGFDWTRTLNVIIKLIAEECCTCGIPFAMPEDFKRYLRNHTDRYFYCPNGHQQHYTGKTEAEKERERREQAERRAQWLRDDLENERRSHTATKGKLTKARRRAAHGVCPVPECRRSFTNLYHHMATLHPGYVEQADTDAGLNGPTDGPYGRMTKIPGRPGATRYRCPCGWDGATSGGHAMRHARTCEQAR